MQTTPITKMPRPAILQQLTAMVTIPTLTLKQNTSLHTCILKQKKYEKARAILEEILELYDYATVGTLPAAYKKLAQMDMEKLPNRSEEE